MPSLWSAAVFRIHKSELKSEVQEVCLSQVIFEAALSMITGSALLTIAVLKRCSTRPNLPYMPSLWSGKLGRFSTSVISEAAFSMI